LPVGSGMGYSFGIRETTINGNERVDCRCRSIEKFAAAGCGNGPTNPICFRGNGCGSGFVTIIDKLYPAPQLIYSFPDAPWSGIAAAFQGNPFTREGDYTATIDWGDGTAVTPGALHRNGVSGFMEVDGTHTWTA